MYQELRRNISIHLLDAMPPFKIPILSPELAPHANSIATYISAKFSSARVSPGKKTIILFGVLIAPEGNGRWMRSQLPAIMSCKYWLGFQELTQQEVNMESLLVEEAVDWKMINEKKKNCI